MSELQDVLNSINSHCSIENKEGYVNLSIGRGEIMMQGMLKPKIIWILNSEPMHSYGYSRDITGGVVGTFLTGRKDAYCEAGELAVSKNKEYARIILKNYEGSHSCMFAKGANNFLIRSSAHYTNNRSVISDVNVGVSVIS